MEDRSWMGKASEWGAAANYGAGQSTCPECGCDDLLVDAEGVECFCPSCDYDLTKS